MSKLGLLLVGVSLIAGCSLIETEKPVSYYVLDAKPLAPKSVKKQTLVAVNAIQLPDYLDQPNLVLRDSSQKLHVAFYHSWAEDFGSAIRRVMISELNQSDDKVRYVQRCDSCQKLTITLNHFYPTTQGEVILAGDFVLENELENSREQGDYPSKEAEIPKSFLIEANLTADGYEHAVKQMRISLGQLAKQVTNNIAKTSFKQITLSESEIPNQPEHQASKPIVVTPDVEKGGTSEIKEFAKPIRRINLRKS
jgi:uncharacterized lipoprotein YmbA